MMVIVDGEWSSISLLFWVCEADCQFLAAMDIVVIVTAIAVVYSSSTTIMGGWLQSLSLPLLEKGEGGRSLFPPHCCGGGDDTKCCCCHCKEGSWMMLTAITSVVNLIVGRSILCRPLFDFFWLVFFFFINVGLLIFYEDQVTVNQKIQCWLIVRQLWKNLFHSSKFSHHISVWQL